MIVVYSDEAQKCMVCNQVNTTGRNENDKPVCAACSNDQYFERLKSGEIVELKIDMRKVRQSTLMAIRAMIQKDIEDNTASRP